MLPRAAALRLPARSVRRTQCPVGSLRPGTGLPAAAAGSSAVALRLDRHAPARARDRTLRLAGVDTSPPATVAAGGEDSSGSRKPSRLGKTRCAWTQCRSRAPRVHSVHDPRPRRSRLAQERRGPWPVTCITPATCRGGGRCSTDSALRPSLDLAGRRTSLGACADPSDVPERDSFREPQPVSQRSSDGSTDIHSSLASSNAGFSKTEPPPQDESSMAGRAPLDARLQRAASPVGPPVVRSSPFHRQVSK